MIKTFYIWKRYIKVPNSDLKLEPLVIFVPDHLHTELQQWLEETIFYLEIVALLWSRGRKLSNSNYFQ